EPSDSPPGTPFLEATWADPPLPFFYQLSSFCAILGPGYPRYAAIMARIRSSGSTGLRNDALECCAGCRDRGFSAGATRHGNPLSLLLVSNLCLCAAQRLRTG